MENYGRYQLLAKLATGGMAQVFLARQVGVEGFEKLVVLKRILPHLAENAEFVDMFLREAKVAARLNHPNVAQIYDLGQVSSSFFIAMEYIHGEDFRRVTRHAQREGRNLPVPLAVRMVIGACAGLDFAHDKTDETGRPLDIVHRDVSPQNLLVTFEGGVKVIDFGIAKAADGHQQTKTGVLKGKYSYMSPEQAEGRRVDRRSDVFALGVILYELVTQTRLFKRHTDLATLQAVMACKVPRPSSVNPAVDAGLEAILLRALARDRDQRTPTAGQLQAELEEYLISHRLPGSTAHLRQFMRELYAERLAEEARLGRPWYQTEPAKDAPPAPSEPPPTRQPPRPPPPVPETGPATILVAGPDPTAQARKPTKLVVREPAQRDPIIPEGELSAVEQVLQKLRASRLLAATLGLVALVLGLAGAVLVMRPGASSMTRRPARLRLETEPNGAEVFVDGKPAGALTPATLSLEPGVAHQLRFEKDGYAPSTESLPAFTGELARRFALQARSVGGLDLTTTPPGASIIVDGRAFPQRSPTVIPDLDASREHQLVLAAPGYQNHTITAAVRADVTTPLAVKLVPVAPAAPARPSTGPNSMASPVPGSSPAAAPADPAQDGTLVVNVKPSGLAVELDGRRVGTTPGQIRVPAGKHELRLVDAASFLDLSLPVTIAPGQTERIERTLTKRRVRFNVKPWAEVYIRDRKLPEPAPGDFELYPDTYKATYNCPEIPAKRTETLVVPPGDGVLIVNLDLSKYAGSE